MNRLLSVLALLLVITGCSQAPPPVDSSVITARSQAWEDALNAGDVDAVVALYTPDARILPPNGKMTRGSAGVRAEFSAMIDAGLSGDLTSVEAAVSGDIAYNVGTFTLKSGDELVDVGKFIEIWRRGDDGQWRIANDIYNSDRPAMMAEASGPHIMISHEVDDADRWMAAWQGEDSRHAMFAEHGAAHVHTFRSADNPNLTGLVISVADMDALEAMLGSEEGLAAAAEDGVRADTIIIMNQVE